MRKTIMLTVAALAASVQLATAGTPAAPASSADVARLREHDQVLAWEARKLKGAPSQALELERRRIDGLIRDLEMGRPVDPSAIDRALDHSH